MTRWIDWQTGFALGTFAFVLAACPSSDSDDPADTDSATDSMGSSGATSDGTTTSTAGSTTGTPTSTSTTANPTSATVTTANPSTTGATTTASSSGETTLASSDSSGSSSGGRDACADLGREECSASEECAPIACSAYEMTNLGTEPWCLAEPAFVGCHSIEELCDDFRTTACTGRKDVKEAYLCPDSCIPQDFEECDPPVDGPVEACQ